MTDATTIKTNTLDGIIEDSDPVAAMPELAASLGIEAGELGDVRLGTLTVGQLSVICEVLGLTVLAELDDSNRRATAPDLADVLGSAKEATRVWDSKTLRAVDAYEKLARVADGVAYVLYSLSASGIDSDYAEGCAYEMLADTLWDASETARESGSKAGGLFE